eukprot:30735-Pelagococcus_subviridis.AAC.6
MNLEPRRSHRDVPRDDVAVEVDVRPRSGTRQTIPMRGTVQAAARGAARDGRRRRARFEQALELEAVEFGHEQRGAVGVGVGRRRLFFAGVRVVHVHVDVDVRRRRFRRASHQLQRVLGQLRGQPSQQVLREAAHVQGLVHDVEYPRANKRERLLRQPLHPQEI